MNRRGSLPRMRRARSLVLGSLSALGVLAVSPTASAQAQNTVQFCDFSNLQLLPQLLQNNGSATFSSNVIKLTTNAINQRGSVFTKLPVPLTAATSFSTHFRFRMTPNAGPDGGLPGGHGMVFVMQNKNPGPQALGGSSGASLGWNGIQPSVGVEFDTVQDNGDPSGNHVAIMQDGDRATHLSAATLPFNLKGTTLGSTRDAWVDYIAATTTINVYVATTGTKPLLPTVSYSGLNLATHLGGQAYVGFTGATGGAGEINDHEVTYFVFNNGGPLVDCIPCLTDLQCVGTPTPACQPDGFCGECSATNSDACGLGEVCDVATGTCVSPNDGGVPDGGVVLPDGGGVVLPDGGILLPDGGVVPIPDGGVVLPDGGVLLPDGGVVSPDGGVINPIPDGGVVLPDGGGVVLPDGGILLPDGGVIPIPDGGVVLPDGGVLLPDGGVVSPDGGVINPIPDGGITLPDGGGVVLPDGGILLPDGGVIPIPDGGVVLPDGGVLLPDGGVVSPDGGELLPDGGGDDSGTNPDSSTSADAAGADASLGADATALGDGSRDGATGLGGDGATNGNGDASDGTFLEGGGCSCYTPGTATGAGGGTTNIGAALFSLVGLAFAARRRQNRRSGK